MAALDAYQGPDWPVDAVHLVCSTLGPKPVHEPLARILLAGSPT